MGDLGAHGNVGVPPSGCAILCFVGWLSGCNCKLCKVYVNYPPHNRKKHRLSGSMAFEYTKHFSWSVVVGLYKLMTPPISKSLGKPT